MMMGRSERDHFAEYFFKPVLNPGLGKPVCSRNPPAYSIISGFAAGRRGRRESGLVTNAPNDSKLTPARKSGANPNDPAAFISGLLKYRSRFMLDFVIARRAFLLTTLAPHCLPNRACCSAGEQSP